MVAAHTYREKARDPRDIGGGIVGAADWSREMFPEADSRLTTYLGK